MSPRAWLEGPCRRCGAGWRCAAADATLPACSACGAPEQPVRVEQAEPDGALRGCLACGHDQLYAARDFPRRLGIAVVVVAALLAPFTYYVSLAVGALVDAALVFVVRRRLHCYSCSAVHHGTPRAEAWPPFQLEVAEVHRHGEKAAVVQALRPGQELPRARRRA